MDSYQQNLQLALQHHRRNELDRAEPLYRAVLAQLPGQPEAMGMLAQLLLRTGRTAEGMELLQKAVAAKPREPAFRAAMGQALAEQGRLEEAVAEQRAAVELAPKSAPLHYNLGTSLKTQGRLEEAAERFHTAIRLQPSFAAAHNNLGNALQAQGRLEEAIAAYRAALQLTPQDAVAHNNLANAYKAAGLMEDAESSYREALRLNPQFAEAWSNLADVCLLTGRHDEALEHGRQARELAPNSAIVHSNYLHVTLFHPALGAGEQRGELAAWRQTFADPLKSKIVLHENDRTPERKLRIGYVSPDFRSHVVGRNLLPLFKHHDRERFEIFCYSGVAVADGITEQFRTLSTQMRSTIGMSDDQLAAAIRHDRIDILVDLTLHMAGNRLLVFAQKQAPVQVTFAGYPGSTGLDVIDYRLTDPHLDPPGQDDSIYAEASVRIPSFWCYDPIEEPPPAGELPAISNGCVTFGCLNNFCKVNERVLEMWGRIFSAFPESRLLLLAGEGPHRAKVIGFMLRRGMAPEQIRFHNALPRAAYLHLYRQMDIALDTIPYNGHTTSLDALFMGVPVVTFAGTTAVGRAGVSQLTNLGLTELIARSPEEYVRIATELARDLPRLAALRSSLRERTKSSPLMDAKGFAASIESAYRNMWRRWCAAQ